MKLIQKTISIVMACVLAVSVGGLFASAADSLPKNASYIAGDATGDCIVNSADALAVINHATGDLPIEDVVRRTAADVTNDNKLNSTDALMILNCKVGNISQSDFARKNLNIRHIIGPLSYDPYTKHVVDEKGVGLLGYAYDADAGIFYATGEGWQREVGYTELYDRAAVFAAMPLDTSRIYFSYAGKQWMIQLWKGYYGFLFSGCEIGFYNRPAEGDFENTTTYNIVSSDYYQDITVDFSYRRKIGLATHKFTRSDHAWWLTGFTFDMNTNLAEAATNIPRMKMVTTIKFSDAGLYKAFIGGLKRVDHIFENYTGKQRSFEFVDGRNFRELGNNTVTFTWQ